MPVPHADADGTEVAPTPSNEKRGSVSSVTQPKVRQVRVKTIVQTPPTTRVMPKHVGDKTQSDRTPAGTRVVVQNHAVTSKTIPFKRKPLPATSQNAPKRYSLSHPEESNTPQPASNVSRRRTLVQDKKEKPSSSSGLRQDNTTFLRSRHADPASGSIRAHSPVVHLMSPNQPIVIPLLNTTSMDGLGTRPSARVYQPINNASTSASASSLGSARPAERKTGRKSNMSSGSKFLVESKSVGNDSRMERSSPEPYTVVLTPSENANIISIPLREMGRRGLRVVNMGLTKYPVLRKVAASLGYVVDEARDGVEGGQFYMCWSDTVLPLPSLVRFTSWQRSNHFPSMYLICKKGHLAATLSKVRPLEPKSFRFHPRSWIMRTQKDVFRKVLDSNSAATKYFIMKPNSGCQGRGIMVTSDPFSASKDLDNYIVQEYIKNPLLMEGKKFDLRVYVLLTSIRDPSIFIFEDGLVRICTDPYEAPNESNIKNACKHLTNYAVNKKNPNFIFNTDSERGDVGNKRNFKFFNGWLKANGHSSSLFWKRVGNVITKTILAAQPQLANVYDSCFPIANEGYTCFEVLGFDILVDENLFPWLLEVNHTPSFATETPLDLDIKSRLLTEVWEVIDVPSTDFEKDAHKEFVDLTRRHLPPWAKNHPIFSKLSKEISSTGSLNKRTQQVDISPRSVGPTPRAMPGSSDPPLYVKSRRQKEDSKIRGFTRVYPSPFPEYEEEYRKVLSAATKAWSMKPPPLKPEELEGTRAKSSSGRPHSSQLQSGRSLNARSPVKTVGPLPTQSPRTPSTVKIVEPPVDEAVKTERTKSLSRPLPTDEELQWLKNLQSKLDELSEDDPSPNDLDCASPIDTR